MYKVRDAGNGKLRRYKVSEDARLNWANLASTWPSIATPEFEEAFEQEYERAVDGSCWSGNGGHVDARRVYEILLDLIQKKHNHGEIEI